MKKNLLQRVLTIALLVFVVFDTSCRRVPPETPAETPQVASAGTMAHARIVSTVPSITETLFTLGLGDRVVGVSRFCEFPPEARKLPRVGGLLDPNIEAIVELRPDVVLLLVDNTAVKRRLESLGLKTLSVDHNSMRGLLDSLEIIGRYFGEPTLARARTLKSRYESQLAAIVEKNKQSAPPRALVSIDRSRNGESLDTVYAAGSNRWFNELLEAAGMTNAVPQTTPAVAVLSREGMMDINPDIIVDLSTDGDYSYSPEKRAAYEENAKKSWKSLGPSVKAVRDDRVYIFPVDYATIPGPRTFHFIEELAECRNRAKP